MALCQCSGPLRSQVTPGVTPAQGQSFSLIHRLPGSCAGHQREPGRGQRSGFHAARRSREKTGPHPKGAREESPTECERHLIFQLPINLYIKPFSCRPGDTVLVDSGSLGQLILCASKLGPYTERRHRRGGPRSRCAQSKTAAANRTWPLREIQVK